MKTFGTSNVANPLHNQVSQSISYTCQVDDRAGTSSVATKVFLSRPRAETALERKQFRRRRVKVADAASARPFAKQLTSN